MQTTAKLPGDIAAPSLAVAALFYALRPADSVIINDRSLRGPHEQQRSKLRHWFTKMFDRTATGMPDCLWPRGSGSELTGAADVTLR